MKYFKIILLGLALSFSVNISATHLLGGEISWECAQNGDYIFTLKLYKECGTPSIGLGSTQIINGPTGNIFVSQLQGGNGLMEISPICTSPNSTHITSCATSVSGVGAVQVFTYQGTTSLPGPIPSGGWMFMWSSCCRPGTVENTNSGGYMVRSIMYPSANNNGCAVASPGFLGQPKSVVAANGFGVLSEMSRRSPEDSLYHDFADPWQSANTPVVWNAGFSSTSPLPNTNTNINNGPVVIDHQTGTVYYTVNNATNGSYAYCIKVEQWRNGQKIAEIFRDFPVVFRSTTNMNFIPFTTIDTSTYNVLTLDSNGIYHAEAYVGDTIGFRFESADFDINPSTGAFQVITFNATGSTMGVSHWNSGGPGLPTITPRPGQTGYSSTLTNDVDFEWVILPSHLSGIKSVHTFNLMAKDDFCPVPATGHSVVVITIRASLGISQGQYNICQGDSVTLHGASQTGSYQWEDTNGPIGGATNSSLSVAPTTSTWYYLTDPMQPGAIDSTEVIVEPLGNFVMSFDSINGLIQLTNTVLTNAPVWYYNGIPFAYPYDTLTPYLPGQYWADLTGPSCYYLSDTMNVASHFNFGITIPSNGNLITQVTQILTSLGFTFTVNHSGTFVTIYITGVSAGTPKRAQNTLGIRIYDPQDNLVFSKDTLITGVNNEVIALSANFNFQANTEYKFVIEGDSALNFRLFENVSTPYTPYDNGITVTSLVTGPAGAIPTQPTNRVAAVGFAKQQFVGLEESALSKVEVYPNPTSEIITVSTDEDLQITTQDATGRRINLDWKQIEGVGYQANVSDLPTGVYVLWLSLESQTVIKKFVVN